MCTGARRNVMKLRILTIAGTALLCLSFCAAAVAQEKNTPPLTRDQQDRLDQHLASCRTDIERVIRSAQEQHPGEAVTLVLRSPDGIELEMDVPRALTEGVYICSIW